MPRLHHLALASRDLDVTLRFYTGGLGFAEHCRFEEGGREVVMLVADGGGQIEVFAPATVDAAGAVRSVASAVAGRLPGGQDVSGASPLLHLAIDVDDVDAAAERAVGFGGTMTEPPTDVTLPGLAGGRDRRVRYAFVRGPDGESVELLRGDL